MMAAQLLSDLAIYGNLAMTEQVWWYVARAGGIVALALTSLSVIWGLLLGTKIMSGQPSPKWLLALHRHFGSLSVVFTGVHVVGLMLDSYVQFGWLDVFVPFASSWRPGAVALGIVTMYLLLAVQLSSLVMKRLPRAWWKRIHLTSYGLFWTGLVHGVLAGTDAGNRWYILGTASAIVVVVYLTFVRALSHRGKTPRKVEVACASSS
jgi:DMSO/TMAO reductase YedYZ heme-binding membrane subunit